MAHLQAIVDALTRVPFKKTHSLVTFDALTPAALRALLYEVVAEIDKNQIRPEADELAAARVAAFLQVLNYPIPHETAGSSFESGIRVGDKDIIYPVLEFLLTRLSALKKRAYVARYLLPLELPPEVQHAESVSELVAQLSALQAKFKDTHVAFEQAVGLSQQKQRPSEYLQNITQLADERSQLLDKLAALRKRTAELPGFKPLLDATSSLRREQEEDGRLMDRLAGQRAALLQAERHYAEVNRRLAETRAATQGDLNGDAVLSNARREANECRHLAQSVLPATLAARRETRDKLVRSLQEPRHTEDDLFRLRAEVQATEGDVGQLTQAVAAAQRAAGDDKLAMFRQQSALVTKKLTQKEEQLEAVTRELEAVAREVEAKEAKLSELSGPTYMKREEFKAYATALRAKTGTYKELKTEFEALREETGTLVQSEAALKARAGELASNLERVEERAGVAGYTSVVRDLQRVSALKASVDEGKGVTLSEISKVVMSIIASIKQQKAALTPALSELRAARAEFGQLEARHTRDRAGYEAVSAGLETTTLALEKEADSVQQGVLSLESSAAVLKVEVEVAQAALDRAAEEASYERGESRFLRDYRTQKELLTQKLSQLEGLGKELRRRQTELKASSERGVAQRRAFSQLITVLEAKAAYAREEALQGRGGGRGAVGFAGRGGATAGGLGGGGGGDYTEFGGANVMTLDA